MIKVLHITPHLGGGVGKAHAAMAPHLAGKVEQAFFLLESPQDTRHMASLINSGVAVSQVDLAGWIGSADIIQIEWWENPPIRRALMDLSCRNKPMVLWSHQSNPIPLAIAETANLFVGSAPICGLPYTINSGFGFEGVEPKTEYGTRIGYLGTVDFKKLSPVLFDVAARLDAKVIVWGDPTPAAQSYAHDMRWPPAIHFAGHTDDPASALKSIDIFAYFLQPDHYGTGENALIEAMSLGCCPVVLNNPVEAAIVEDGVTGFVCNDADDCAEAIKYLRANPNEIRRMGQAAARYVAEHKTAAQSAQQFLDLWADAISQPHEPHGAVAPLPVLGAD